MSKLTTLNEFIMDREDDFEFATGELSRLLNDIAVANENSEGYIDETYGLLVAALQVKDREYESLDEMLDSAPLA